LIGVKIFSKLIMNLIEAQSDYSQKALRDVLSKSFWEVAYTYCQSFVDMKFKDKFAANGSNDNKKHATMPKFKKSKYAIR